MIEWFFGIESDLSSSPESFELENQQENESNWQGEEQQDIPESWNSITKHLSWFL